MKFRHVLTYAAPLDEVYAMLADPEFREFVAQDQLVDAHSVSVSQTGRGMDVAIDLTRSTDGLASFAKSFVGESIKTEQRESWTGTDRASMTLSVPGKPGSMTGTITLTEAAGVTTETIDGDIKVSIPLVGGKLEGVIADLFTTALQVEQEVGTAWLAGEFDAED
ncbi:DUF2505 domain-containing protein [Nostocoides jenkinsii]|uniref:DUF2505 domain-containing protein n=1 Tax=Nostocoides jenkinsii Ben 74 TaxID=1193518 RepID=A0A077MFE6_9MICO|nr:DUF2505 domain-containing protein [Tetrasphaera jenkinsii]CCI53843.1 conserved hypothetical protein [Tetrasphaera jenkinsii Ben 74]